MNNVWCYDDDDDAVVAVVLVCVSFDYVLLVRDAFVARRTTARRVLSYFLSYPLSCGISLSRNYAQRLCLRVLCAHACMNRITLPTMRHPARVCCSSSRT